MNEKIEKSIIECIKLRSKDLCYSKIEDKLKDFISENLENNFEYYIDESGLDGRNIEFNLIDISNREYIYEVIINKKKIEDRLNDICTISDNYEYNHQKIEFVFELLYELILLYFEYNKAQNNEVIENLKETYIEKYLALEKAKSLMIKLISKLELDTNQVLDYLEKINLVYEMFLNYESRKEIDNYKANMIKMCEKFKKYDENIDDFLERIENIVSVKISNLDNSRNGSESKAILQDLQLDELIDYIKQDVQVSIYNFNKDVSKLQSKARKIYNELDENINNILVSSTSCENISKSVSEILSSKKNDLVELEKIDPEKAVYEYLVENYSEVANVLSTKMDILQFLDKIDNLPKEVEKYLRNEFLSEYKIFIEEIKNVGTLKQNELEEKISEFEEKYTYNVYYKYLKMTKSEKEELLSSEDKEIKENILMFLNLKKELANITLHNYTPYMYLFNYILSREENLSKDNEKIISYLKSSLKDTICIARYFTFGDVSKAFFKITNKEIEALYEKQNDVRKCFMKCIQLVQNTYEDDILKCAMSILDIFNFKEDNEIKEFLSIPKYTKILDYILGICLYELDNFKEIELDCIKRLYNSQVDIKILKYINLKYKLLEYNLKQKSALENIKVKIPDILGINTVIKKIDRYNIKMLYINRDKKEIQNRKLISYKQREDMILNKINFVRQKNKI